MNYKEKVIELLNSQELSKEQKEKLESIFPELREESKDERIRKRLIEFFKDWGKTRSHCWSIYIPDILAWLEKQGEGIIPLEEIILNVWELGNYWKELTKGVCNTEHGRQLDYIVKHWKEGEHYIKSYEITTNKLHL